MKMPSHLLRDLKRVGRDLFLQGMNSSHSGNLSCRIGSWIWITKRGARLGRLSGEDVLPIPMEACAQKEGEAMASSELPVHREIYRQTGASAVVHCHPPHIISLSYDVEVIRPPDLEGRYYLPVVRVLQPRTPADPHSTAPQIASSLNASKKVVIVRGHGVFSIGRDLWEAFHWVSTLEQSCKIMILSSIMVKWSLNYD